MLTLSVIKNAKPQPKPYRLSDFGGLFVLVQPTGSKLWRWKYRRPGTKKENLLSFGSSRSCRDTPKLASAGALRLSSVHVRDQNLRRPVQGQELFSRQLWLPALGRRDLGPALSRRRLSFP